ncbi:MAG TPA: HEAT repeat domain-containing protein, partial [Gemmatimonadaceae bacterium]
GIATVDAPRIADAVELGSASSLLTTLAIVWGAVAISLLGWLTAGAIHVRRIVRGARELTTPDWTMPLCEVADRLDLEIPPRLVLSDRIEMAFACRALSPTIVLPAAAESWNDDRRRAVLFHELAHIKRHDLLGHTLGRIACALYWFHPLVWTAAKHLRAESERACDDLVLSCGARPSEYAQHLLDMVTSVRNHGAPVMALPMARKKEFEGRMLAILDPAIRRASPGKLQAAGVLVSLATLSLTIAAASPARAASAPTVAMAQDAPAIDTPVKVQPTPRATQPVAPEQPEQPQQVQLQQPRLGDPIGKIATAATNAALGALGPVFKQVGERLGQVSRAQPGDTAKIAMLIRILEGDSDADVRKTAAWGLNDAGGDRVRAALLKALKSDADANVREMAAWALADHESDAVAAALGDALMHDKSDKVRETSAWALGQIGSQREIAALESGASDADASVREVSIWAIGQLSPRTAPRAVVNALTDNSAKVRLVAAWALAEIEDKAVGDALLKAFQTETDTEVRSAELRAIAAIGEASPAMLESALKSTDPELRRRAVSMLAGGGSGVWPWPWPWPQPRPFP